MNKCWEWNKTLNPGGYAQMGKRCFRSGDDNERAVKIVWN